MVAMTRFEELLAALGVMATRTEPIDDVVGGWPDLRLAE
jgi:hypothetical protein